VLVVLVCVEGFLLADIYQRYSFMLESLSQPANALMPFEAPFNASEVRAFLEAQYVPEIGLLRASTIPGGDAERVYIASDNLLASKALEVLASPIAYNVSRTLMFYYNCGYNGQHEILLGVKASYIGGGGSLLMLGEVYSEKFGIVFTVCWEIHDSPGHPHGGYADLMVYMALNSLLDGDVEEALKLMDELMSRWDGYGFRDSAWGGWYESYKLALAVFLWRALNVAVPGYFKYANVIARITHDIAPHVCMDWKKGIRTHYRVVDGRVIPEGDCNVETTSIYVLAYLSDVPVKIGLTAKECYSEKTVDVFRG